jgi:mannan endo-1,4-beta-mannosidase
MTQPNETGWQPRRGSLSAWCAAGVLALGIVLTGCGGTGGARAPGPAADLVDDDATDETRALFANLRRIAPEAVLFGHQDDLAYGVHWKREAGRSDVKDVTGAYPAVYGWELADLELGAAENIDGVRFDDMRGWIKEGYERGGVVTISWHMNNLMSGGNAWDTTRVVPALLPGGMHHEAFKGWLDDFADFVKGLKVGPFAGLGFGTHVPIIFRPYHEMTGSWFWWGAGSTTPDEYKALWRFTVGYLRDVKGVSNLLYAYATDVFPDEEAYLLRYPGDAYVDVLGFDDYHALRSEEGVDAFVQRLRTVVTLAEARGKVPAFTETGYEGIPEPAWWTSRLLRAITADPVGRRIAYMMVWRNANAADMPGHHFVPYAGHPSAPDFVRFYQDPFVLFGDELPDLYRWPPAQGGAMADAR